MELSPVTPTLQRLFRAVVEIATPLSVGMTPRGERRIIPITGGRFEGDKLAGDVLPGGADWQLVRSDGTAVLEARYTLRTQDGALISVRNRGVRSGPPGVLARLARRSRGSRELLLPDPPGVRDRRAAIRVAQ